MRLFYHCASGFYCDAENGLVFGKEGNERGSPNASGYKIVSYVDQHTGAETSKPAHRIIYEAVTGYQNSLPSDVPVCHLDTVHGFRSSFRDWASETTTFQSEVVEMALAHTIRDKTEAAYRRGSLLPKRRTLMDAWADFLLPNVNQRKQSKPRRN